MSEHRRAGADDGRRGQARWAARGALGLGAVLTAMLAGLGAGVPAAAATPRTASLPAPATGHRPGPDILYAPPAVAPQLTNAGIWTAPSILISGASAYRGGEYLYQDFLYDDHGAAGLPDPGDQRRAPGGHAESGDIFALPGGTYTYPRDPRYAGNAADLVEFRIRPLADATAFRVTLNTLLDPSLVGISIAIGAPGLPRPVPHGANATATQAHVLTAHGTTADLDGLPPAQPISVTVDMTRRQFEIRLPHADYNPGTGIVPVSAGVGLWDVAAGRYLIPGLAATATAPGGGGLLPTSAAFFNLAFRTNEPIPSVTDVLGVLAKPAWWRDQGQATALGAHNLSADTANVDFSRLTAGTTDDSGVPVTGPMDRILQSHFESRQGTDYATACSSAAACQGELRGNLQPYAIYVPPAHGPAGFGMTLQLHSLSATYNQYLGSRNQSQFGTRAPGSIVITPSGPGLDGWYYDVAGADTFEVWADVASRYRLDPDLTVITGYSMGGYGTYKLGTQFPDLFARAQPTVGPPGLGVWVPPLPPTGGASTNTNAMLGSLRNLPILIWNASTDELVPTPGPVLQQLTLGNLGYRYTFDLFTPAEHLTLAANDQYQPAADFLGSARVDRDPPHVTYVRNPSMDFTQDGTTADHAYWLSDIAVRSPAAGGGLGIIDVRSESFGVGDPPASGVTPVVGTLTGGKLPLLAITGFQQTWGPAPARPVADRLDVIATNVSRVVVDPVRARIDCHAQVSVRSDGPVQVVLGGACNRTVAVSGSDGVAPPLPTTSPAGRTSGLPLMLVALGIGVTARCRRSRRARR